MKSPAHKAIALGSVMVIAGVLVAGVVVEVAGGPEALARWWNRRPAVTLAAVDATPTPEQPDPGAFLPEWSRDREGRVVETWGASADVRVLEVVAGRWLAIGTAAGLRILDLFRGEEEERCFSLRLGGSADERLGPADGLPAGGVTALLAVDTTLYVGTEAGLAEVTFGAGGASTVHPLNLELASPRISALTGHAGAVHLGTHDGGVYRLDEGTARRVGLGEAAGAQVTSLLGDPSGVEPLYIGTTEGLLARADGRSTRLDARWVTDLHRGRRTVWVASPEGRGRIKKGRFEAVDSTLTLRLLPGCPEGRCPPVATDLDGHLTDARGGSWDGGTASLRDRAFWGQVEFWATDHGVVLVDRARHVHPLPDVGLPDSALTGVGRVGGRLFVATFDAGLYVADGPGFRSLPAVPRFVNGLAAGRDTLWVATSRGLVALDPETETTRRWGEAEGLAADHVNAVAVRGDGTVVAGTAGGITRLAPYDGDYRLVTWRSAHGLADGPVQTVAFGPDDRVRVGTLRGFSIVGDRGVELTLDPTDGRLPDGWVTAIAPTADTTWVGTYDAGLVRFDPDGTWTRLDVGFGKVESRVNLGALAWHRDRLYVGTDGGGLLVVTRDGLSVHRYLPRDGLPSASVTGVFVDGSDLWVATRGGLARLSLPSEPLALEARP